MRSLNEIALMMAFAGLVLVSFSSPPWAAAQDLGGSEASVPDELQTVDRTISAVAETSDAELAARLRSIFTASEKFEQIEVEVTSGLVFLSGSTKEESFVEWAAQIAKQLEGVIGVVNNIQYLQPSWLDISPVKNELNGLATRTVQQLPLLLMGLLVFLIFIFLSRPLAKIIMRPIRLVAESELIRIVIARVITIFIMLIGFYFFLRIAGLTQFAVAVISGTGVIGLILGFAFRDIAENFISSLLISAQRPFALGDVIEVEGHKGIVRKVTARGTTLIDFDGNHIQIPNATIYKNILQNFTANPNTRGNFVVGIGYDVEIAQAKQLALRILEEHPGVLDDPAPQVLVEQLASSTVNLKLFFWVDTKRNAVNKVSSVLMSRVMKAFSRGGISMPDDAREIVFPDGVPIQKLENDDKVSGSNQEVTANQQNAEKRQRFMSHQCIEDLVKEDSDAHSIESDTKDIIQQGNKARDPEQAPNII